MHALPADILICRDDTSVAVEAARRFVFHAAAAVNERGKFCVAIPGGFSPRGMFEQLARPEFAALIPWDRTHVFFTDERCVPPTDPDSNYKLARDLLLSRVPIPEDNVHRFQAELDPEQAARLYEEEIKHLVGECPAFDLIVLGMGKDTHTASLFPHSPALKEETRYAVANPLPGRGETRLTLTLPVFRRSLSTIVLVLGYEKSGPLHTVLISKIDPDAHPIQSIAPTSGDLLWIVDQDAASQL
jgi:6-phosphogluconolactonase